jgi:hypothetical protein
MGKASVRFLYAIVCVVGIYGCDFPRPADVAEDAAGANRDASGLPNDSGVVDSGASDASFARPTIASVTPDWGSMTGGTRLRLTGSGFGAPHLAVQFGELASNAVTVVSDVEIIVTTPVGPHMAVTVTVATDGGTTAAAAKFRYLAPLYAADGRGVTPGNLYMVDPTSAVSTFIGALGVAVTGLALSPGGVLFGATTARGGGALVTIDPYTARVTTVAPLLTTTNAATSTPDLAFEGTRLLGWHDGAFAVIDPTTARVTPFAGQSRNGGMGLASAGSGVLLLANGFNLATVNTTNGALFAGPTLSSNKTMNSLTFVGSTLYGSQATTTLPNAATLVTINPATGATTIIGTLPPNIDAIEGIPTQPAAVSAPLELAAQVGSQIGVAAPAQAKIRVGAHSLTAQEIFALARHDQVEGERGRHILPLSALATLGIGDRVEFVSVSGDSRIAMLDAPGLALTMNYRQELKLVDTREGFHRILAPIVEIRDMSHR